MPANFGDLNIKDIRYQGLHVIKAYFGNTLIYDKPFVRLKFHFDRTNVNPRGKFGPSARAAGAEWISTSDPQIWYAVVPLYTGGAGAQDSLLGLGKLFNAEGSGEPGMLLESQLGTCQVLEITGEINRVETIDRIFQKCTAITSVSKTGFYDKFASSTALKNVNAVCHECTNITDGSSLNGYLVLKDVASITTHAGAFTDADSAANLDQIPVGWGGNQVPVSTLTSSTRLKWWNNYDVWTITANGPDWTDMDGVYLLTTASVSSYTGVSMNRSRIKTVNGLTTGASNALYFYPCFMQHDASALTWAVVTEGYNGMLAVNQGNTDMPGTLDYTSYGPFKHEFGVYDSTQDVYFCFLVTNVPIDNWTGLTDKYGILYNQNFNEDAKLRWFV